LGRFQAVVFGQIEGLQREMGFEGFEWTLRAAIAISGD